MNKEEAKSTARALDRHAGFHFVSKKPEITRKVFIKERTKLPLVFLSASVASLIVALGVFFYEKARLAEEQHKWTIEHREGQKRFLAVLESAATPTPKAPTTPVAQKSYIVKKAATTSTPIPKMKPTVRAVGAEVDGKPINN